MDKTYRAIVRGVPPPTSRVNAPIGREPGQRTTLYQSPPAERVAASRDVRPLETPVFFTRGSARHRVRESSPEI